MIREDITIVRSNRKTVALEIKSSGEIILRAPMRTPMRMLEQFVEERSSWIDRKLVEIKRRRQEEASIEKFTEAEVKELRKKAKKVIPMRVDYYADLCGIEYGRIAIKSQRTVWGSCSNNRNLNFNCLLMLVPVEIMDYVIVHELCHIIHLNHSKDFWDEVGRVMPDYKIRRKWLKENGAALIRRLPD